LKNPEWKPKMGGLMTERKSKIPTRKRLLLAVVIATLLGGGGYIYITRFHNPCENKYVAYEAVKEFVYEKDIERYKATQQKAGIYEVSSLEVASWPWPKFDKTRVGHQIEYQYKGLCNHNFVVWRRPPPSDLITDDISRVSVKIYYNRKKWYLDNFMFEMNPPIK